THKSANTTGAAKPVPSIGWPIASTSTPTCVYSIALYPAALHSWTQRSHASLPANGRQVASLTIASPIRVSRFSRMSIARIAPVGQTCPQALQLDSQPAQFAFTIGVQSASSPWLKLIGCKTLLGHALKHSPQRIHI